MNKKECICKKLNDMNIKYTVINHRAIFSEKDINTDFFDKDIIIGKNLFLRNDKKTNYYLFSLPLNKRANLEELAKKLNEKRFSFANEKELDYYLNISAGSVSYLNVITAAEVSDNFKNVIYVIDKELLNGDKIGFHPSDNTATIITTPDSILKIYDEYNLKYCIIDI